MKAFFFIFKAQPLKTKTMCLNSVHLSLLNKHELPKLHYYTLYGSGTFRFDYICVKFVRLLTQRLFPNISTLWQWFQSPRTVMNRYDNDNDMNSNYKLWVATVLLASRVLKG